MRSMRVSGMADPHGIWRCSAATTGVRCFTRRVLFCFAILTIGSPCLIAPTTVLAEAADVDEVKAAFLFQFLNYVTWPEEAFEDESSPIVICITGNDKVYQNLVKSVKGRKAGDRPIEILEYNENDSSQTCHIVFIGKDDSRSITERLKGIGQKPVLTIGDSEDFTHRGGIIRLYVQDAKLKIEIHRKAAEEAGLKISSKLLRVSDIYEE